MRWGWRPNPGQVVGRLPDPLKQIPENELFFQTFLSFGGSRSNLRRHERVVSLWFASTIPQLTFLVPALAKNDFPDLQSPKCGGGGSQIRVKLPVGSLPPQADLLMLFGSEIHINPFAPAPKKSVVDWLYAKKYSL